MQGFKKAIGRTTQKIKRTVSSQSAHKDPEYDMLMHSVNQQERTLTQFDKHIVELVRSLETQVSVARSMIHDYRMVYAREGVTVSAMTHVSSSADDDQLELVQQLAPIVDRMEREVVRPFVDKCASRVQQPIREYVAELAEAKGGLNKTRHNKLLDYEVYRDKFNSASTNTKCTVQQVEEARMAFENARVAFDEIDQQVKQVLREIVLKRYTVFHPLVSTLYGELLSEYYDNLSSFASLMKKIRSARAPEVNMPERYSWGGESSEFGEHEEEGYGAAPASSVTYSRTTTTTTTVLPPNPTMRSTPPLPFAAIPAHLNKDWYYLDAQNEQKGPVSVANLKSLHRTGAVSGNTYVVTEGMANWELLGSHELNKYVQ